MNPPIGCDAVHESPVTHPRVAATRRRLLVLGTRAVDPEAITLKAMIAAVLTAADEGRLAPAGYSGMAVQPSRDDRRSDAVPMIRATGRRMHVRFSHDGPFRLTHADMPAAVVDALRRPVAGPAEAEAELDVLGALVAITDAGARQLVACSRTPWQKPLITGEIPMTLTKAMSNTNAIPPGQSGVIVEVNQGISPIDPEHSPLMADVVHVSDDGGDLLLSPLRVEGPRDGFVFAKNLVVCLRTGPLPGPMDALRILSGMRRPGSE